MELVAWVLQTDCLLDSGNHNNASLPEATLDAYDGHSVVVVGGTAAVPESKLKDISVVQRLWGKDRLETMRAVVTWADVQKQKTKNSAEDSDAVYVDRLLLGADGLKIEFEIMDTVCRDVAGGIFVDDTLRLAGRFADESVETIEYLTAEVKEVELDLKQLEEKPGGGGRAGEALASQERSFARFLVDTARIAFKAAQNRAWLSQQQRRWNLLELAAQCADKAGNAQALNTIAALQRKIGGAVEDRVFAE